MAHAAETAFYFTHTGAKVIGEGSKTFFLADLALPFSEFIQNIIIEAVLNTLLHRRFNHSQR